MLRSLRIASWVAFALMLAASEGEAADLELEGFTTATLQGDSTVRGFTEACQAELGASTRMCTSVEVIETVNWPSLVPDAVAWTQPVFVSTTESFRDASGFTHRVDWVEVAAGLDVLLAATQRSAVRGNRRPELTWRWRRSSTRRGCPLGATSPPPTLRRVIMADTRCPTCPRPQ